MSLTQATFGAKPATNGNICIICGGNAVHIGLLPKTVPNTFIQDHYALLRCPECDLVYADPMPPPEDLETLYGETSTQFDSDEYAAGDKVASALEYYTDCLRRMLGQIAPKGKIRLLEVGAGCAWLARAARQANIPAETVAQDVSPEVSQKCSWVDQYIVGQVTDRRIREHSPYDIISLTHVIEHLTDPIETLKYLRELLKPNGRIFVTAPHRPENWDDSIEQWKSWSYNHTPGHINYFSERSIGLIARKLQMKVINWSLHENGQAFEAILG